MNGIVAREDFINAVKIFANAFPGVPDVVAEFKITESELRLEQPLVANANLYTFPVLVNETIAGGVVFNTEIRLRQQDTFVPTAVRIALANPSSATDTTFRLFTYPNQFVFVNDVQMRALYNSRLSVTINNYQYLYNWGVQRHWYSPQTQQTAALGAGSPEDQLRNSEDGFFPLQPFVLFGGAQNVQIQIVLAQAPTAVDANSRFVMQFYGVLAQNSTPVS